MFEKRPHRAIHIATPARTFPGTTSRSEVLGHEKSYTAYKAEKVERKSTAKCIKVPRMAAISRADMSKELLARQDDPQCTTPSRRCNPGLSM